MYKNNLFVATIDGEITPYLESAIKLFGNYSKEVKDDYVYLSVKDVEFTPDLHGPTVNLINILNELSPSEYAFIKFGDEVDDTEVHGMIQNFGITVKRSIEY